MVDLIDINAEPENLFQAGLIIGALKSQLENFNFLKYCIIVRNEIEKFDAYVYETNQKFEYIEEDLEYFVDFYARQEEKRKLRWIHLLKFSSHGDVKRILDNLPPTIAYDDFARNISKAYRLISQDIHNLCYTISMKTQYCLTVTSDKQVNECVNLIMSNVETNVGKMLSNEPPQKKSKPCATPSGSSL